LKGGFDIEQLHGLFLADPFVFLGAALILQPGYDLFNEFIEGRLFQAANLQERKVGTFLKCICQIVSKVSLGLSTYCDAPFIILP